MLESENSGGAAPTAYQLVGAVATFRVNQNNTTTPIVEITARSVLYDVQFTWDVLKTTFDASGAKNLAELKTSQVNEVAAHDHVQALRSEKDQDRSGLLYNYLVITVGTPDLTITNDVTVRMDHIADTSTFDLIDKTWAQLVDSGAPTS